MGLIQRSLDVMKRALSIENPSTSISQWINSRSGTSSGQVVTPDNAWGLSVVYACVKILSEDIASLPLSVYKKQENGNIIEIDDHNADNLISKQPSPLYTPFVFHETLISHAASWGNGYAIMHSNNRGEIEELEILDPTKVTPKVQNVDGKRRVFYHLDGQKQPLTSDEVLHIPALSMNGIEGKSPITVLRETVGEAMAMVEHGNAFYANGAKLTGVIEYPSKMTEEGLKNLRASWNNLHTGRDAQGTAILEGGATFKPISLKPEDLLFIENRKFSVEEIARAYRIPLHMLNSLDRATFSNIEQQSIDYVKNCLTPWVKRIEAEYNRKLFTPSEQGRYFVKFDLESRLEGDSKAQAEFYSRMFQIGVYSQNDVRQKLGHNPIEGGDEYYVAVNLSTDEQRDTNNDSAPA